MTRSWSPHKLNKKFCYWSEEHGMRLLEATAAIVLKRSGDFTNFVERGDLISEGWLRVTRFSKSETMVQNSFNNLTRSMRTAKRKCENPHYLTKSQPTFRRVSEVEGDSLTDYECGAVFVDGVDVIDELLACCRDTRDKKILHCRLSGLTHVQIGQAVGISGPHTTNLLHGIYDRYQQRKEDRRE